MADFVIVVVLTIIQLVVIIRWPSFMYWMSLAALWVFALVIAFRYEVVLQLAMGNLKEINDPGPVFAVFFGCWPFLIPFWGAFFTHVFLTDLRISMGCFLLYAILQTVALGMYSGQDERTHLFVIACKMFVPVISLMVTVIRTVWALINNL